MVDKKDLETAPKAAEKSTENSQPITNETSKPKPQSANVAKDKPQGAKNVRAKPQAAKTLRAKPQAVKAVKTATQNAPQAAANLGKSWKALIAGCFGDKDKRFAKHENDKDRAYKLLTVLREEKVGWKEFRKEVKRFLSEKIDNKSTLKDKEIKKQLKNVREHIKVWLKND